MKEPRKPDLAAFQRELEYGVDFKPRNLHPGKWPAAAGGGQGFSFEKFERLSGHPDFRRIDALATGRNPLSSEPLVRIYKPAARIDLFLLADLSLSLSCGFSESKVFQTAKLATLFGYTAFRWGDRFGFLAFDRRSLDEFFHPPVRSRTAGLEIGEQVLGFRPSAPFEGQPLELENYLPQKKSLVIFVSDFYLEAKALRGILAPLSRHRVLPILLRHDRERRWPPGLFGALNLKDSETGRERTVLLSRRTISRFEKKAVGNEEEIRRAFRAVSADPVVLEEVNPEFLVEEMARRIG